MKPAIIDVTSSTIDLSPYVGPQAWAVPFWTPHRL